MVKLNYVRVVPQQAYVDGQPVFRPEWIGIPYHGQMYAEDENAAFANLRSWQRSRDYVFQAVSLERCHESDIPKGQFVFNGYQLGYVHQ